MDLISMFQELLKISVLNLPRMSKYLHRIEIVTILILSLLQLRRIYDKGRIIYINGFGYFDAISANPKENFLSLVKFADVLQIDNLRDTTNERTREYHNQLCGLLET